MNNDRWIIPDTGDVKWNINPHEAKTKGLKEAIKWLDNIGISMVSIELDSKQVVDGIARRLSTSSMFGAILDICKASLKIYQKFKIHFYWKTNK